MRSNPRTEPALLSKAGANPSADPVASSLSGKSVVLCLGNRYLGDDGIGIRVADALNGMLGGDVLVEASQTMDLPLLSQYEGASRLVVVDSLKSGARPGEVSRYTLVPNGRPLQALKGPHSLELHDFFDIAWQTGLLGCPVTIVGVEPKDCGVGEGLTKELEGAIPRVVAEVEAALAC
jgi:hydrogenase maturation protease